MGEYLIHHILGAHGRIEGAEDERRKETAGSEGVKRDGPSRLFYNSQHPELAGRR